MAGSDFQALSAVAFQLVAALDAYADDSAHLAKTGPASDLYSRLAERMDEIQRYCNSLPAVSVPAVALLIAHAEFVYSLWHLARTGSGSERAMTATVQEHRACIESLRRACARLTTAEA